jgi:hypothetical protein
MSRRIAFAALFVLSGAALDPAAAPAITYSGDRGGTCAAVGAGNTHVITMTNGTSVGTSLVLTGAITGGSAAGALPVIDTRGNNWFLAHSYTAALTGERLFVYETKITAGKAHSAGDTVTLSYAAANGQVSCAVLSNFTGLATPSSADRVNGNSASGTSASVATGSPTTQADEVLVAGFGYLTGTGGFTYGANFNPLSSVSDGTRWLFPGYRILSSTGSYSATATTTNSLNYGAILVTFKGDTTIFIDGFENQTCNNWSVC